MQECFLDNNIDCSAVFYCPIQNIMCSQLVIKEYGY